MKLENLEKTWDNIARKWNDYRTKIPVSVEKFLKQQNGKVLDLGCGSGRHFIKNENLKFYGVDFSEEMLKYAREKNVAIELKKSNSFKIPYENDFFDAVLCYSVLHCIKEKSERQKTIEEIYRTLKPKSRAFISVWGRKSARLKNKPKECFVPWSSGLEGQEKRFVYIYDKEELKKELENAGFKILNFWEERNINAIVEK